MVEKCFEVSPASHVFAAILNFVHPKTLTINPVEEGMNITLETDENNLICIKGEGNSSTVTYPEAYEALIEKAALQAKLILNIELWADGEEDINHKTILKLLGELREAYARTYERKWTVWEKVQ